MAFKHTNSKGKDYYLHSQVNALKSTGKMQTIYFFAKEIKTHSKAGKPVTALDSLPAGKRIVENEKTGLPFVKGKG